MKRLFARVDRRVRSALDKPASDLSIALSRGAVFSRELDARIDVPLFVGPFKFIHFGVGKDGASPAAGLIQYNGKLYGTTTGGGNSPKKTNECISSGRCGTIYKIDRFGNERVIYRFTGDPDGANPEAALINEGGVLYGTTFWGGTSKFYGTLFRIFP